MRYRNSIITAILSGILWGCSDDAIYKTADEDKELDPGVEAYLSLSVNDFDIINPGTREADEEKPSETKEEVSAAEKRINNIWVFQFDATSGDELVKPQYLLLP